MQHQELCFCCKKEIGYKTKEVEEFHFCSHSCRYKCYTQCILLKLMEENRLSKKQISKICDVKMATVFSWLACKSKFWARQISFQDLNKIKVFTSRLSCENSETS